MYGICWLQSDNWKQHTHTYIEYRIDLFCKIKKKHTHKHTELPNYVIWGFESTLTIIIYQ